MSWLSKKSRNHNALESNLPVEEKDKELEILARNAQEISDELKFEEELMDEKNYKELYHAEKGRNFALEDEISQLKKRIQSLEEEDVFDTFIIPFKDPNNIHDFLHFINRKHLNLPFHHLTEKDHLMASRTLKIKREHHQKMQELVEEFKKLQLY